MIIPVSTEITKRDMAEEVIEVICIDDDKETFRIGFGRGQNNDILITAVDREGFVVNNPDLFPTDVYDIQEYEIKTRIIEYLINSAGNILGMYSSWRQEPFDLNESEKKQEIVSNIISFLYTRSQNFKEENK